VLIYEKKGVDSQWHPDHAKAIERKWIYTPQEAIAKCNELERELADKDRQLAEAGARIDFLDHVIDSMNNELAELCPEGQTVIELLAQKDKLIERMKNCQNCGRTGGFCKHCRYAPDKRGWDDNWKEPI